MGNFYLLVRSSQFLWGISSLSLGFVGGDGASCLPSFRGGGGCPSPLLRMMGKTTLWSVIDKKGAGTACPMAWPSIFNSRRAFRTRRKQVSGCCSNFSFACAVGRPALLGGRPVSWTAISGSRMGSASPGLAQSRPLRSLGSSWGSYVREAL